MRKSAIVLLGMLATTPVSAAELTVEQVIQVLGGLTALDCSNRIVKDGGSEKTVCEPYKWSAGMAWQIATMQQKAREVATNFQRMQQQEVAKLPRRPDGTVAENLMAEVNVRLREVLDTPSKVTLDKLRRSDLEQMTLPPSVISALLPVIE